MVIGFKKCCISDEMNGWEGKEEDGNVGSEDRRGDRNGEQTGEAE
jgi:hypothetical protein